MASTKINVGAVIGLSSTANRAKLAASNVRSAFNTTKKQIDSRILDRNNLASRFQSVYNKLGSVETKISRIRSTVENGANWYHDTDLTVQGWANDITGNFVSGCGLVFSGIGIPSGGMPKREKVNNSDDGSEVTTDPTWKKILKDDWVLEGAVLSGARTDDGEFLGISTSGTVEGELIGGSIKTKSEAEWDKTNKEFGLEKSVVAEGHIAKGSLEGSLGILNGKVEGTIGAVSATGSVGASLYKDGKLSPALEAKLKAKAAVAEGEIELSAGDDEFNAHAKGSGTLFGAEAEASGGVGMITYETDAGVKKTELGVQGKVGAEAYIAEGKLSGGVTIFGIDIDVGISGKAGGAGVSAGGQITGSGASGEVGAGLGLGLGLKISVDWSDFSLW